MNNLSDRKLGLKILFLDIDGVLVPFNDISKRIDYEDVHNFYMFDKKCVKVLNEIIDAVDFEIIISSDWKYHYTLDQLRKIFKLNGINKSPFGVTIEKDYVTAQTLEPDRCFEIEDAVEKLNPEKWCSVDDLDLSELGEDHFVLCGRPYKEGIKQTSIKEKIIERLS
jgi:hypothetical protein